VEVTDEFANALYFCTSALRSHRRHDCRNSLLRADAKNPLVLQIAAALRRLSSVLQGYLDFYRAKSFPN
jgi:hypothetical protein